MKELLLKKVDTVAKKQNNKIIKNSLEIPLSNFISLSLKNKKRAKIDTNISSIYVIVLN
ncbi:MAG TPA: hypothetical protein VJ399_02025 [Patescibacteria group bacterium]|nr:hypothetical protein [Patescibacteria group bacterium]